MAFAHPQIFKRTLIGYLFLFPLDQSEICHPLRAWAEQTTHQPGFIHLHSLTQWLEGFYHAHTDSGELQETSHSRGKPSWPFKDSVMLRSVKLSTWSIANQAQCSLSSPPEGMPCCFPTDLRLQKLDIKSIEGDNWAFSVNMGLALILLQHNH